MGFWIEGVCFMFISMSYYQLTNFLTDLLINRYNYQFIDAARLFSLIPIVVMIATPLASFMVTFLGMKAHILFASSAMGFLTYLWLYSLPVQQTL